MPGDVLTVPPDRLQLKRDYAVGDDEFVERALSPKLVNKMKDQSSRHGGRGWLQ